MLPPREHLVTSGDIFDSHAWPGHVGRSLGCCPMYDKAQHRPHNQDYPSQSVSGTVSSSGMDILSYLFLYPWYISNAC